MFEAAGLRFMAKACGVSRIGVRVQVILWFSALASGLKAETSDLRVQGLPFLGGPRAPLRADQA